MQIFDLTQLVDQPPDQDLNRFMWSSQIGGYDESPMVTGDYVCLQCGLYSPTPKQVETYARFKTSCDTFDSIFKRMHPCGLKRLAFSGWAKFRTKLSLVEQDWYSC